MTDLVTTGSDLSALSIEQINWLLTEAGSSLVATAIVLIGTNASDEVQYEVPRHRGLPFVSFCEVWRVHRAT